MSNRNRKLPWPKNNPLPAVKPRVDPDRIVQTRRYKLITPLYGGGVTPGEADPITVVRATEVRGHLRFWWRATLGDSIQSVDDLWQRESEIWGSTETASGIQVEILESDKKWSNEVAFRVIRENEKLKTVASPKIAPYAAFPLLPDKDEQKQVGWKSESVLIDVTFDLRIQFPNSMAQEIEAALWAWETFGGIGARTRRGFGALQRFDKKPPYSAEKERCEQQVRAALPKTVSNSLHRAGVPMLVSTMRLRILGPFDDSIDAWKDMISTLYEFRQSRYGKKYGLSKWPEANEIRRLHTLTPRLPENEPTTRLVQSFPRAQFGLPIVFHMPHDSGITDDLTLEGMPVNDKTYDRLASRLILRPLACSNGKYMGLAAILQTPHVPPGGLRLKGAPGNPSVSTNLTKSQARHIDPLNGNTDVLQAFLDWL